MILKGTLPIALVRAKSLTLTLTTSIPLSSDALSSKKFCRQLSPKSSLAITNAKVCY